MHTHRDGFTVCLYCIEGEESRILFSTITPCSYSHNGQISDPSCDWRDSLPQRSSVNMTGSMLWMSNKIRTPAITGKNWNTLLIFPTLSTRLLRST